MKCDVVYIVTTNHKKKNSDCLTFINVADYERDDYASVALSYILFYT